MKKNIKIFISLIFIVAILVFILLYNIFNKNTDSNSNLTESTTHTSTIQINYILPEYIYESKDQIYTAFFTELYNYTINYDKNNKNGANTLKKYKIENLEQCLEECLVWDSNTGVGLPVPGAIFKDFFLQTEYDGTFASQRKFDSFATYCLNNNKFVDLLYFLKEFFYHWRLDEGYTGPRELGRDPRGSDFFASPYASIIDTAKFFYYDMNSLPKYIIDKKNIPNLYNNIPGLLAEPFIKNETITFDDEYVDLNNNYQCPYFEFVGYHFKEDLSDKPFNRIKKRSVKDLESINLYLEFKRIGKYAIEIEQDEIIYQNSLK